MPYSAAALLPSAQQRIVALLDDNTFRSYPQQQHGAAAGQSLVTGTGTIDGVPVCVFAQDTTYFGGSVGVSDGKQIAELQQHALNLKRPIIGIWDGGGARIQDGVGALAAFGNIFRANVKSTGHIAQVSVVVGACAGGACYSPALTDFIIMIKDKSRMFLTGPEVTRQLTGDNVTAEQLGGCQLHTTNSGVAHYGADNEQAAFAYARNLLSYVTCPTRPQYVEPNSNVAIPLSAAQPYDMRTVLRTVFDQGSFLEVQPDYAANLITGYARIAGKSVAIVASQPMQLAGVLDAKAAHKGARFVATSSRLGLPIITFVDVPGFLPGVEQEEAGIIQAGADLVQAYVSAKTNDIVPLVTVIIRKAFGGAYIALGSKSLGADWVAAWPTAQIGIMDAASAVGVVHRRELAELAAADGQAAAAAAHTAYVTAYQNTQTAQQALLAGQLDAVIAPDGTRRFVLDALDALDA